MIVLYELNWSIANYKFSMRCSRVKSPARRAEVSLVMQPSPRLSPLHVNINPFIKRTREFTLELDYGTARNPFSSVSIYLSVRLSYRDKKIINQ